MKQRSLSLFIGLIIFFGADAIGSAQRTGRIIVVLGSDTSVRSGLDVARYRINAKSDLYVAPNSAAYRVMNPAYRSQIVDSYGRPFVMTWWMLGGGIFRYGVNNNAPYANIMPLHLMRKLHGPAMQQFGDELTLHYHTWIWSDYNDDGIWFWNQSLTFEELREDFDFTLAQGLLEDGMFPVSFRSGWHYMDNGWQQYLDKLLPYSMHNDYPHVRADNTEPIDNVFDWSRSSPEWKPYRPSPSDYQLAGDGRGWNLRSSSMGSVSFSELQQAFERAATGEDQVLCLWDHLAADNFFTSLERATGMLNQLSTLYSIPFRYTSAVEAMQIWRGTQDTAKPVLSVQEIRSGNLVSYRVETNEPIFQIRPFFAVKTRSEQFVVAAMESVGTNLWRTAQTFNADSLAKVACAVTDTAGNLTTRVIRYLPEDMFIENSDPGYRELRGQWRAIATDTWGVDSRAAAVGANDSASVEWQFTVPEQRQYKIFVQQPFITNPVPQLRFELSGAGLPQGIRSFSEPLPGNTWVYLGTYNLSGAATVRMTGYAGNNAADLGADVIKISPLVQDVELTSITPELRFNFVSLNDTVRSTLLIENRGLSGQTITGFSARDFRILPDASLPFVIPAGESRQIPVGFVFDRLGRVADTLIVQASRTSVRVPAFAEVEYAVRVVDNDDATGYYEWGPWNTSTATAFGRTSRFSFLNQGPGQYARYTTSVPHTGYYDVQQIVPGSTNATNHALYTIASNGRVLDSIFLDQRQPSSRWVSLGIVRLEAGLPVEVRVTHPGGHTAGDVLRADAVKLLWVDATQIRPFTVDNDSAGYFESGTWARSVTQAYGPSSRFSIIGSSTGQYASFTTRLNLPGRYDVRHIVPASSNATDYALYTISVASTVINSQYVDQRPGGWRSLGTFGLPAGQDIEVRITHAGGNTAGNVLRADAVMLVPVVTNVREVPDEVPHEYVLGQNYPNPFNPSTEIRYQIPGDARVTLKVFDLLGRAVTTLVDEQLVPGTYTVRFNAGELASGVYMYRLEARSVAGGTGGTFTAVKKMMVLK